MRGLVVLYAGAVLGLECLKGGMEDAPCTASCPPCWKKSGSTYFCFEYTSGVCSFDWVDVGRGSDPDGKPTTATRVTEAPTTKSTPSPIETPKTTPQTTLQTTPDVVEQHPATNPSKNHVNQQQPTTSTVTEIVRRPTPAAGGQMIIPDSNHASLFTYNSLFLITLVFI
ncbi:hypothetical protein DSO57_1004605 [Entomophthora muscae]|uniref:Uncharacterized protein n=1 Tax=Entomophthora muscae TaxID=34485 RepID=A0ACC2TVT4_9FUNG|nr:hypothetical protein DSO57_1004605 [Entomophthora muscae]